MSGAFRGGGSGPADRSVHSSRTVELSRSAASTSRWDFEGRIVKRKNKKQTSGTSGTCQTDIFPELENDMKESYDRNMLLSSGQFVLKGLLNDVLTVYYQYGNGMG